MRLALLSDIHGNLFALNAVLNDIESKGGVDEILGLGRPCRYWAPTCRSTRAPLRPTQSAALRGVTLTATLPEATDHLRL